MRIRQISRSRRRNDACGVGDDSFHATKGLLTRTDSALWRWVTASKSESNLRGASSGGRLYFSLRGSCSSSMRRAGCGCADLADPP
jgi:hypothetical protein